MSEINPGRLQSFVARIEKLNTEKAELTADIAEIYKEVASAGYDKKVVRALIAERAKDEAKLAEHEALLEAYRAALGDLKDTPLGVSALKRAA